MTSLISTYRIDILDGTTKTWQPLPDGKGIAAGFMENDALDYVERERARRRMGAARVVCEQTGHVIEEYR